MASSGKPPRTWLAVALSAGGLIVIAISQCGVVAEPQVVDGPESIVQDEALASATSVMDDEQPTVD